MSTSPIRKALQDADKIIAANAALEATSRPRGRSLRGRVVGPPQEAFPQQAPQGRPLHVIADEAQRDMRGNVPFGAVPYLQAMWFLDTLDGRYGEDDAVDIVTRFLGNVGTWRSETARAVKAELRAMLKAHRATR